VTDLAQIEINVRAQRLLQVMVWRVRKMRRAELMKPIPRSTCPGCFSTIYDGAAEQGWCCDCFGSRAHYERDARLPNFAPHATCHNGAPNAD
jgi:hypothetical protein